MSQVQTRRTAAQRRSRARGDVPEAAAARMVKRLFVVRESTAYKYELFAAMMYQVLSRHAALSSVATILGHGAALIEPGDTGRALRHQLGAQTYRRARRGRGRPGRALAYLFTIGEDAFLLSQMSAARPGEDGTNAFGATLADIIRDLRPEELHTGPASRFGRTMEVFTRVGNAAKLVDCKIFSDEAPEGLDLTVSNDALRWEMYGLIAGAEVREILKRLTIGRLIDAKEGRWPFGPRHIVLGYECDTDKIPTITGDPKVLEWVRLLIELGADPRYDLDDIVAELAAVGLTTPKLQDIYGTAEDADGTDLDVVEAARPADLSQALRPREVVQRLYGHLETYLTGTYRFELTCPVPGVTEWCSTPVHRQDGDPYGVFQIEVPVGLPEGGWADPETIRKAIDLRCTSAEEDGEQQRGDTETSPFTGGAGHEDDHKPFSGFDAWSDDTFEYVLSAKRAPYHVLRRDTCHTGANWHEGAGAGELLAALNPAEFHVNVADRVLTVLEEEGVDPATVVYASRPSIDGTVRAAVSTEHWNREIARLESTNRGLRQAVGRALGEGDEKEADQYETELRANKRQIAEFERLVAQAAAPAEQPVMQSADVTGLPELLKLLRMGLAQYPGMVSRRVHRLIHGLRFEVDPFTVRWSCRLRLPTDAGLVFIPVSGQVRNVYRARGKQAAAVQQARTDHLAKLWIEEGLSVPAIAAATMVTDPDTVERWLRRDVVAHWPITEAMATAVLRCPFPRLREVLHRMHRTPLVASPYARTVLDGYSTITSWREGWNSDLDGDRQRVIDVLWDAGGGDPDLLERGLPVTDLAHLSGVDERKIAEVMAVEPHDRGGRLKAPLYGRVLEKDRWTRGTPAADRRIRLRRCPWCDTRSVTVVRRVPELGACPVLCRTCRRRPDDPAGVVYPPEYVSDQE